MEYTPSRIKEVLGELHITPLKTNKVDTAQAAKILTWRLKTEHQIERPYSTTAVRRRVDTGALEVKERVHPRFSLYDVRDIFELPLMPSRAEGAKHRVSHQKEKPLDIVQ
jgi:hypothetical protein